MVDTRAISATLTAFSLLFYSMAAPNLASGASSYSAARMPVPQNRSATNAADSRCDQLADSPDDPAKIGNGVPIDQINVAEALPVCEQAARRLPPRPRYQYAYGRVLAAANRYTDAARQYSAADQGGCTLASNNLGLLYQQGNGVPQDYAEAARLYGKSAKAGNPRAFFNLGNLYLQGLGVTQDNQQAVNLYFRAGEAGYAEGYANLGAVYARTTPPNYPEAAKWVQKAVQGGSPFGDYLLGWLYEHGKGVAKNDSLAMKWYTAAANAGEPNAMYRVGVMLENGQGVQQDFAGAARWFYKAGWQGHASAQAELAYLCYTGQGVSKNYEVAYSWFVPAAQAGLAVAQNSLGSMYENGEGVAQSDSQAVAWFRKAAEQNDVFGMDQLAMHLRLGVGVAWNEREAMQWFQRAADLGYAPSQESLGYGYIKGLGGGTQDYQQAAYWTTKAARQGNAQALINLGLLYQNGWGVDQDLRRARELFLSASNSPIPEVADSARNLAARVPELSNEPTPSPTDKTSDWVPFVAVGVVAVGLLALFSNSSRDDSSSHPSGSSSGVGPSSGVNWPTTKTTPPPPPRLTPHYPNNPTKSVNGDLSDPTLIWH